MKKLFSRIIIFILFLLVFVMSILLFKKNADYNKILNERDILIQQKAYLESELNSLNNTLIDLQNKYNELNLSYYNILEKYNDLLGKYEEVFYNYSSILNQLNNYIKNKEKVQKYIQYNLNYDFLKEYFINDIKNYCIYGNVLNYPCIVDILKRKYNFSYKELELFIDEVNVSKFIKNKYGDCKSWSFFSISIINFLYKNKIIDSIKLYYSYPGEKFILYYEEDIYYYYPDSKEYIIDFKKYPYLYVFCYYNLSSSLGHCFSGLSNTIINPENYNSENILIFEPQSGEFLGTMKEFLMKNKDITLSYIFSTDGQFYHRPLYLAQWSEELWIWI